MDNKFENIDNYYKENLENYSEDSHKDIWKEMRWTLFWMRYKWILGISAIILFLGVGGLIYSGYQNSDIDDNYTTYNTEISSIKIANYESIPEKEDVTNNQDLGSSSENTNNENSNSPFNEPASIDESTTINEPAPAVISNSMVSINIGKTNLEIEQLENVITENSLSDHTYRITEILVQTPMDSKELVAKLSKDSDTIFGQNINARDIASENRKGVLSMILYAGPAYSNTSITGNNAEYLSYRNANETNHSSWSMGGEVKLNIKNWIITSGLSYSVYNQQRSYMHNYQEYSPGDSYYDYDTTWNWFFDPPEIGVPIIVGIDSSWIKVYNDITIDNSGINKVTYIEIPLLIGYRFNANMFSIEINTGTYLGFLLNSNIKVPDFANNIDLVESQSARNTMVNFAFNTSLYYHLNRKTSLYLSPYYKQNLNSVFNDDYPVNQRIKSYGINFGISLSF